MRKLNKNEKSLLKILTILIILLGANVFVINPINLKIRQLENDKQNIMNIKESNSNIVDYQDIDEEDIILKVQNELKNIVYVDYMDKRMIYDEYNNDVTSLEIKVIGNLEQIFKIQDVINKLELNKDLKYLELNAIKNSNIESENIEQILECILQINVG